MKKKNLPQGLEIKLVLVLQCLQRLPWIESGLAQNFLFWNFGSILNS